MFLFNNNVGIQTESGSKIILNNAHVRLGFPIPNAPPFASKTKSSIYLGKNSKIIFNGAVTIAPGANIRLKENAVLIFEGKTHIAHDFLLICSQKVHIGEFSVFSWNVSMIDDDGHHFSDSKGRLLKGFYKPLVIGKNVGIQMNSIIPRGISVGDNSVISCGTVARTDIPANCLAYQDSSLRIRKGISAPVRSEV
jgi:acetyltransferase-like isoleucine patch superfamily enzyme